MTTFTEQFLASSWVAEKRSSIPVLASVLIDADERTVTFTDMDILLILRDVPITGTGKRLFNAERLTSLLKTIAESFQALTLDGDMLVIDAGHEYKIQALGSDAADFPIMAYGDATMQTTLAKSAFTTPAHAMSKEETRYYLNGIYCHAKDGKILTVATNGHHICVHETGVQSSGFDGFIIPRKTIKLIKKLADDSCPIAVELRGEKARLLWQNIEIVTKLIDGTFPEYARVIPDAEKATATLQTDWSAVAAFCKAAAAGPQHGIRLTLLQEKGELSLVADEPDASLFLLLPASITGFLKQHIGFNRHYLAEIASALAAGSTAYLTDPSSPVLFVSGDDTYAAMPMRI